MTGAPQLRLNFKIVPFLLNPDYCQLFLHCHERKKNLLVFRREETPQSLRPADAQTEGKRALVKKRETRLFPM